MDPPVASVISVIPKTFPEPIIYALPWYDWTRLTRARSGKMSVSLTGARSSNNMGFYDSINNPLKEGKNPKA